MQSYIAQVRAREDQQWVQRLVEQGFANRSESIFIDTEDWVMCSNIHAGAVVKQNRDGIGVVMLRRNKKRRFSCLHWRD